MKRGTPQDDAARGRELRSWVIGSVATLAVAVLYAPWMIEPHIRYDDFNFLTSSRTPAEMWSHLWQPMNDHVMPLARLAAGLLMYSIPGQSVIPLAAQLQGVVAVVLGMWLIHLFVKRELGHAFYGVIAMTLWGVTSTYYECVTWYSASFFTLALDVTLLSLLAAQSYRQHGRWYALAGCTVVSALAPAVHGTALLAGVWCAIYLAFTERDEPAPAPRRSYLRHVALAAVPFLGTLAFVGTSLATSAGQIIRAQHYQGKTVFGAFDLSVGLQNTLRTLADNQLAGAFGIWDRHSTFSWPVVLTVVLILGWSALLWWRLAPRRRLLILGLSITLASNVLVYSGRAEWSYDRTVHNWTRYHLFPHLGLVLFAVAGLPHFEDRWFALASASRLSRLQGLALLTLIAAMVVVHMPRSHGLHFSAPPEQKAVLLRVERIDRRCQSARISAETARQALGFLQFPLGLEGDNSWDFLRCSSSPIAMSPSQAKALLRPEH